MTNGKILLSSGTMHGEEIEFVKEAFDRNWVTPLGFNCDAFEETTVKYLKKAGSGCSSDLFAFATASGTAALHLAVKLAGIKRGDHVLCSDMTFAATVNPITYEGGIPVFIDSEPFSWNMCPMALEKGFEKYPDAKAVILAHLYGTPSNMDRILDICHRHGAVLIEDAAEALSATYKGRACGTFGDYVALSYNGNKIITTSGGGMLITKKKEARDKAMFWATQARENAPWYQHEEIGYNYRMSNICAGIGRGQMLHLDEHRSLKEAIYFRYKEGLKDVPVKMNPFLEDTKPNFWLSCITIKSASSVKFMDIYTKLAEKNIESRPIWKPMHIQPVYKRNDFISVEKSPVGEYVFNHGLCLPSDIKMDKNEQDFVIETIKSCF